jgi:site-specific recombinase XerD
MAGGVLMKKRFYGPLGQVMERHLKLRRSLGFVLKNAEFTLDEFDRYLANHFSKTKTITRPMVVGYLKTVRHLHPRSQSDRVNNLRQFSRYLFQFDISVYIPERSLVPPVVTTVKPHIYTEAEVKTLIGRTATLYPSQSLVPHTYEAIIGLLWVSGLRIGEVARLNIEDVDLTAGVLHIKQTKFFKSRLVPLSRSSVCALSRYKSLRDRHARDCSPAAGFFINRRRIRCDKSTMSKTIQGLIRQLGLRTSQGRSPRVHDLRHSFATHSLARFYQDGRDPSALLPVLATFLGHANIANTQVYLHPSLALLEKAGDKFRRHISQAEV